MQFPLNALAAAVGALLLSLGGVSGAEVASPPAKPGATIQSLANQFAIDLQLIQPGSSVLCGSQPLANGWSVCTVTSYPWTSFYCDPVLCVKMPEGPLPPAETTTALPTTPPTTTATPATPAH